MERTERLNGELANETESHKLFLKKQEILYQTQLEAASAFVALHRTIEPKYRHPDMDWDEALDNVVDDFTTIEKKLRNFISAFGAVLSSENRVQISTCMITTSNYQFAKHEGASKRRMRKLKLRNYWMISSKSRIEFFQR